MANWVSSEIMFGTLLSEHELTNSSSFSYESKNQMAIRNIQFDAPQAHPRDSFFAITAIDTIGPCIRIAGTGRWGAGVDLSEDCWKIIQRGVLVLRRYDMNGGVASSTISINGVEVFHEELTLKEDDEGGPCWDTFTEYEGHSPAEKHFFSRLWCALENKVCDDPENDAEIEF